jgi:hypothetical protein
MDVAGRTMRAVIIAQAARSWAQDASKR